MPITIDPDVKTIGVSACSPTHSGTGDVGGKELREHSAHQEALARSTTKAFGKLLFAMLENQQILARGVRRNRRTLRYLQIFPPRDRLLLQAQNSLDLGAALCFKDTLKDHLKEALNINAPTANDKILRRAKVHKHLEIIISLSYNAIQKRERMQFFPSGTDEDTEVHAVLRTLLEEVVQTSSACRPMLSDNSNLDVPDALDSVDRDKELLLVGEEVGVTLVKTIDRTDEELGNEVVRYNGPLDFVVGHIPGVRRSTQDVASDAALCVVEAKKSKTFEDGCYQVLAQASTILYHRRNRARGRGAYRTYFAYTDAERWAFEYLRAKGDHILVKR
ncbi:hypothetical protein HDU86_003845 [Geranomyces michiganensis]|nr:hypothetical protein HDU86_003845 [Geranomyces michiganensis]